MMKSQRPVSSMGANNNNNNSYGNNDNDHFNDLQQQQQVAADDGQGAAERRLAADENHSKDEQTTSTKIDTGVMVTSEDLYGTSDSRRPATGRGTSHYNYHNHHHHNQSKISLFVTILLPFVLVFLLPSSIDRKNILEDSSQTTQQLDHLLLSLLRLPLDRFRLSSGYSMMLLANAKEIQHHHQQQAPMSQVAASSRQVANDLQEEETHMLMVAPEQQQQQQRQPSGYQLGPVRQAASYGGGPEQDGPYGHDNAASSHANLIGNSAATAAAEAATNQEDGPEVMPASASGSVVAPSSGSVATQQTRTDLPSVRALNVKCEKNHMTVNIVFDRPFYGMVFSKGHYNDQKCVHLPPNSGQTSINFDIHLGKCGMSSSSSSSSSSGGDYAATNGQQQALQASSLGGQQPNGLFIENTIVIQYDPQVQEIYDQARRLRCTWYDYYEKSVTFRPYNVDMLDAVTANFLGDNIQCWMQIQVGKGPWSSEVAGIVKIGQTMTMVLAIKDDENKFDMLVRNCVASDGKHPAIQLVDEYGCVARPKIMAKFQKVRNFGPAATVVSYAHFQAFKFPDSMSVHFQCVIQVCRYECPEPVCSSGSGPDSIPGSLAGPTQNGAATNPQDYAASGTELVSSKEPLPVSIGLSMSRNNPTGQNLSHLLQQQQQQTSSGVNLKLDESQGRVQVKLDTSMMANTATTSSGLRGSSGPLPPHLLHSSSSSGPSPSQHQAVDPAGGRAGHTYLSSSYYRPSLGSATAPASRPVAAAAAATSSQMRPMNQVTVPPGGQYQQYSNPAAAASSLLPPHHHHPRPAYMMTNRMGELVAEDGLVSAGPSTGNDGPEDYTKLSLIASPRALPYAMPTTTSTNHRYRRSINASTSASSPTLKAKRQATGGGRQAAADSTAIKTQRTIQVVSPDDVAFNLIDLDPLSGQWPVVQAPGRRTTTTKSAQQYQLADGGGDDDDSTMVCFSAGRLITSALASLALLVTLVLAAAIIIMRQRKRLDEKLSPVYDSSSASPDLIINSQSSYHHMQQHQRQQQQRTAAEEIILRRQREEIQQRNTYLGRLYSQFVPAAYWR